MSLPILDGDARLALDALSRSGAFRFRPAPLPPARLAEVLAGARAFFDLSPGVKASLAIEQSPHFRGYSEMKNERDWREQLHLGREAPAAGDDPTYLRLEGPNLWPPDAAWRVRMIGYLAEIVRAGEAILARLSADLGLPPTPFAGEDPYLVMKLICYHPQPDPAAPRPGVAAHVDFSTLTLTLEDDTGGLEIRSPDGRWAAVDPAPGTILVHAGEILEMVTGGRLVATPHRVVNPSPARARVSIPVFLCPGLRAVVTPVPGAPRALSTEHIHRVASPDAPADPFVFGEAEWRRKGLGVWCAACVGSRG